MTTPSIANRIMDRALDVDNKIFLLEQHVDDLRAEKHGLCQRLLDVQQEIGETYVKISNLRKEKRNGM
jgi:hypothetical protein